MRFLAIAALLVLSVGGCWFATQYVAWTFGLDEDIARRFRKPDDDDDR